MNGPRLNLDWGKLSEGVKKFQYPLIVLLIGLVLLAWPSGGRQQSAAESEAAPAAASQKEEYQLDRLEQRLADSLSSIAGVGEAEVVLTLSAGSRDILAQDEEQRGEEFSRKTVILDGSDRQQTTVTTQVIYPTFQGALVVCDGGGSAAVRLNVLHAVEALTGLTADHITVCARTGGTQS